MCVAAAINELTTKSTGTRSGVAVPVPCTVRSIPLPAATITPIAPFKESTHPGYGSNIDGVTKNIKKIVYKDIVYEPLPL